MSSNDDTFIAKFRRGFFIVAGTLSLALGAIGIFIPLLPTTPLLLLSAACYYKGSKRMHHWMLNNRWFGAYLRNYREGRGISFRSKIFVISILWIAISYSIFVVNLILVQLLLLFVAAAVTLHVLMLPTFRKPAEEIH